MKLTARPPGLLEDFQPGSESLSNGWGHPEPVSKPPTDIFLPLCLFKNETQVLSPIIFTKRLPSVKPDDKMSTPAMMLECLCALVNRFYYKSTFEVAEFMKEILVAFESGKRPPDAKKPRRRTHPTARKTRRIRKKDSAGRESEENEATPDRQLYSPNEGLNILDYLVSPLKTDFCVGKFSRELERQRSGGVRGGPLQLRQALRPNSDDG
jgi:hypothetical protein